MNSSTTARLNSLSEGLGRSVAPDTVADKAQELDSELLLAGVAEGDREALSQLFARFCQPIRSVARRILRDDTEAEDLVQDVFLYVYRRSSLFDSSKGSARSWIFQVTYTHSFLRRRHLKAHGFYSSGMRDKSPESDPVTSAGADYDRTVEGLFGRAAWQKVLEILTEEQRETLRLHFFEDLTFAEIAEKLGQTYANVRNHHYRGLEKLRRHLKV